MSTSDLLQQDRAHGPRSSLKGEFAPRAEVVAFLEAQGCTDILARMRERYERWETVCDLAGKTGALGTVLTDEHQGKWCLITPDPKPGMYRYSCLDRRGFTGHGEYSSPEAALVAAFGMGFEFLSDSSVVDRVIASDDWM